MPENKKTRREVLRDGGRLLALAGAGAALGYAAGSGKKREYVWQLDPYKCIQCGKCATECVLEPSAVKCVHAFAMCGYCELCTGYFEPDAEKLDTAAENALCPTGAIKRSFVEDPYYAYVIDEALCVGCGKCVAGCAKFGNGSLFLQVRHDRCVNCNECAIAKKCPAQAFSRVPADQPYLLKQAAAKKSEPGKAE
jgi:electron transport complex protein RnfB